MRDEQQDPGYVPPESAPPAGPPAEGREDAAELLRTILHPLGLALGVMGTVGEGDRWRMAEVRGLTLQSTADPEGIVYGDVEEVAARNVAKLRAAGHVQLAEMEELS
jgi:hypothetical protein